MSTDTDDFATADASPEGVLGRVDEAIFALDTDWQFRFVNEKAATLLETETETLLGDSIWDVFPDATETDAYDEYHAAMETGEPTRFDLHYEPTSSWFSIRAYPGPDGLTVCFYDVTEERGRQLELQRKQRLFEAVFEDTEDALVIADSDRRITEFNPAAERLFGYEADEVLGERSARLYADEREYERQGDERFNEEVGERQDTYIVEYERADGTTFEGETVGTALEGGGGETLAFLGAIRDVSARVEYENRMEARNEALRTFHDVTTDATRSFEERLTAVLELGAHYLGLDVGLLSAVEGTTYTVEAAVSPEDSLETGDTYDLGKTFCEFVVGQEQVVSFADAAEADVQAHPAYDEQGIESYLGAPVLVDGERYGTLNFSSSRRRGDSFTESEETFVRVLAQWAGKEVSRRQQRDRARANRDRLRQVIDTLPQLVFAKDGTGEFLLANEAVAEAYGTTVDNLEGATDADFATSSEEAEQFRADDHDVIESGEPKLVPEEPLTTADGERRIFETRKIPYDPVDVEGEAVLGVSTDITERKEREAELEMQSAAMEASMDGIAILDDDEYIYMNQAHADIFGYEVDDLLDSAWRCIYDDAEIERLEQEVLPELGETGEWRGETVGKRQDGSPVHQEITLSLLDDGKLICTNRDITAQKQREQELERYEALVESMDEAAFVVDGEGRLEYANEASLSYVDATVDEVDGQSVAVLADEMTSDSENPEQFEEVLEAALDGADVSDRVALELDVSAGVRVMEYQATSFRSDGERKAIVVARDVTDRRERERELEHQRSRLRALFDNSPDSIIVHDAEGTVIDANETQLEMLGHDRDTLCSMNVAEFEVGLGRAELQELWAEMAVGDTMKVEGNHRRSNGHIYPVEVWVAKTEVGDEQRFVAVSRDISERKAREQEILRNREFLEKTQESASIGGWEVDLETGELRWTDEVYRIHGLPVDEDVALEDGIDFYHPEDRSVIETAFERLRSEGEPYDLELRIVTADERVRWVRTVGDPQFEDGEVVGVRGVFQDITERKEREQDLREVTERLDLAVEGANLGVWDWDMRTDEVAFNDQWVEMLGLSPDEVEPTLETWEERVHPADMERVEAALEAHMAGETELYDCEHRMRTAAGDWKWLRDVGEVVERNADGDPIRAVGIHLDISEQKETQTYLEEERDMFAQGPAVVFKWRNEAGWPVEYVSENVTDTFGYTPEDLESGSVPYETLIHDADAERVQSEVEANSDETTERFSHDPYRMVTADGDVKWVTDNTKIIRNDGEITHYLGYLIDVTERKHLEQSLRENEQSLREVSEIASDTEQEFQSKLEAILDLGCTRLNLPYGFLNRLDGDTQHVVEATGTHPLLQPGESAPRSQAYCRKTVEQDEVLDIPDAVAEGWGDDPAYETFGLGCYIGGTVVVDGETYGTLCFAGDDSRSGSFGEADRAFVELLVQWISYELEGDAVETKLRRLNETAQRLMATGDRTDLASITIESANSVLSLPMTGIWWYDETADALVPAGMTDEAVALLDEQPTFDDSDCLAWQAFTDGETNFYDDLHTAAGRYNEETPLQSEVVVPLGGHGVLITGSTQQRAFSETDRTLLDILASTVEEALNRAEREHVLRETQADLEQSNEQLQQFAYAASHDLQEPLRTVSSYLTLLERRYRDDLSEDALEFVDIAVDGADRMREMIQALLEYSRVDTRGGAFEPTAIEDVFQQVTENLELAIEEADAVVTLPETPGTVVGDETQLVQLFQNLVENGIKYSDDDPRVDVSIEQREDVVEFAVTDNGIGIEPDQVEEVFEVFQRLHTREEVAGTGIGLSLCRKIVDRHDGDIRVESTPGEGSTFFVTIPADGGGRD